MPPHQQAASPPGPYQQQPPMSGPYQQTPPGQHPSGAHPSPGPHSPGPYPPGPQPGPYPPGAQPRPYAPGPYSTGGRYAAPPGGPYAPPGANPYGPYQPRQQNLSFGAKVGIGAGVGLILAAIVVGLMFWAAMMGQWYLALIITLAVPVAAVIGMIFRQLRPFATGVLIIMAAAWIVIIGPCMALFYG